jgi:osmoprotectant transport system permease protein
MTLTFAALGEFGDAISFIFTSREHQRGSPVGGSHNLPLLWEHLKVCGAAMGLALLIALPLGLILGHTGKGSFLAISVSNIGRAVPSIALIALFIAFFPGSPEFLNVTLALTLLAIPPILTNTYVGMRQVDPELVDAARGQGLSELQVVKQVELPLALPTIFGGIRISAVTVLATAIIAPRAGLETLGTPIISFNVYGEEGQIGAAILVAFLTLATDAGFALVQRLVTPKGLKVAAKRNRRSRTWPIPLRRVQLP